MRFCFNIFNIKSLTIFTTIILIFSIGNKNTLQENRNTNDIEKVSNTIILKENNEWKLEIPKINLEASICEGTSSDILNKYIGHFEETQRENGNVVLAAHNRGYKVNYFQRLKELETGDIVFYTYLGSKRKYVINEKNIIKDTDVNVLQNTEDNIITLITCVENMPELRRCIKAIQTN